MTAHVQQAAVRKVAIIGGASSRTQAPYDDTSWDIWAFSSLRAHPPRITRWFEMHTLGDLRQQLTRDTPYRCSFRTYMDFLLQLDCPIYMQRTHRAIPNSVRYPLRIALDTFGRCFTSTASYLLALAILEGYETIGVWGIHLTERRIHLRQRPGVEYLLGIARRRGIHILLPAGCPLRVPRRPRLVRTSVLYGYDWLSPKAWWRKKSLRRKVSVRRRSP